MQVGDHHCVTKDGVVVVRGWGLSGSCVGRLTAGWTQPSTTCSQKRAAVNPQALGAVSARSKQPHDRPAPGHTFFCSALLHEPGSPDIILAGIEAAGFEET